MKALTLLGVMMGALVLAAAGVHKEAPGPYVDHAPDRSASEQDESQDEEAAVVAAVERLFESMRTNDGEMARSVFHPDARLGRATADGISFSPADGFIERIGTPKDQVWDEPIWDWNVDVDGRLAQMWTKYAFYLDDAFSHCGVDAIQLYRSESGWQITQLVDTNRQDDCWYPPGRTP